MALLLSRHTVFSCGPTGQHGATSSAWGPAFGEVQDAVLIIGFSTDLLPADALCLLTWKSELQFESDICGKKSVRKGDGQCALPYAHCRGSWGTKSLVFGLDGNCCCGDGVRVCECVCVHGGDWWVLPGSGGSLSAAFPRDGFCSASSLWSRRLYLNRFPLSFSLSNFPALSVSSFQIHRSARVSCVLSNYKLELKCCKAYIYICIRKTKLLYARMQMFVIKEELDFSSILHFARMTHKRFPNNRTAWRGVRLRSLRVVGERLQGCKPGV